MKLPFAYVLSSVFHNIVVVGFLSIHLQAHRNVWQRYSTAEGSPPSPDDTSTPNPKVVVNGSNNLSSSNRTATALASHNFDDIDQVDMNELLPLAPAVSYRKFLTMQEKRVVVTIRYCADAGWKPYFLTVAKKLKQSHPDVIIERRILPKRTESDESMETFEVRVDGKVVVGNRLRKPRSEARCVYVSMVELDLAISRARRRLRPSTTYGSLADSGKGS